VATPSACGGRTPAPSCSWCWERSRCWAAS
jgi:hypothetical protein